MSGEETFWITVWRTVAASVVAIAAVIGGCNAHQDYRISQAIERGADPVAAYCAFSVQGGEVCHTWVAVQGRNK